MMCDGCEHNIPHGDDGYHREEIPGTDLEYVFYCTAIDVHVSTPAKNDEEFPF